MDRCVVTAMTQSRLAPLLPQKQARTVNRCRCRDFDLPLCRSKADPEGGPQGCGPCASRPWMACLEHPCVGFDRAGLCPCKKKHFSLVTFFCCFRRESYPHPLGGGSSAVDVTSPPCGNKRRNRRRRGRGSRRSYPAMVDSFDR